MVLTDVSAYNVLITDFNKSNGALFTNKMLDIKQGYQLAAIDHFDFTRNRYT